MKANGPSDVTDVASARRLLEDAGYLVPGELFLMENVALVLFQAAKSMPKPHKATSDIIRALGYTVGEINTTTLAETIATSILEKLGAPITLLAEATTAAAEISSNLSSLSQPLTDQPGVLSYARAVSQAVPPHHAEEVTRGVMMERRMIVGGKDEKELAKLTEKELVAKANMALSLMSSQDFGAPEGITFLGAEVLRSRAIAYHLNTTEAATWIQQPDIRKRFVDHFGSTSAAHSTLLHCVAEYVPVTFDTTSLAAIQKTEADSGLQPRTLQFAKFIKNKERRYDGQRVAHAIFGFLTRDAANYAMTNGLYVEGKRVNLRKLLPEPRRCLKCQIVGAAHLANDCPSTHDTCARCAEQHRTDKCEVKDREEFCCSNCQRVGGKAKGHGTGDRACPVFQREMEKLRARTPGVGYRYFPTADPRSWQRTDDRTGHPNQHDATWERESGRNGGGWTEAQQGRRGGGYGHLGGGARSNGGGFMGGAGPTMGDVPVGMRPSSQRQQKAVVASEQDGPTMEKGKGVAQGQGEGDGASRGKNGAMRQGRGMGGPGRGANRGAQDDGWRTREQKQSHLTNYFQTGQASGGRTTPWGDREEGEEGVPPLPMTDNTQT